METLLTLTLSGSALALLLLALRYVFLRRMPSTVYYYAWLLVLLRFALPLPGLVPTAKTAAPAPVSAIEAPLPPETGTEAEPPAFPLVPVAGQLTPKESAAPAPIAPTETPAPAARRLPRIDLRSGALWLGVWAVSAVLSFLFTVGAYLRFTARLRRELQRPERFTRQVYAAIPGRKPALYRSAAVRTPLTYGFFSPKIVLPARVYDEELLTNILRHELTHYRRLDTLYKWAAAAVLSTQWFNPLSYLIRRELNRACELSCDEMLLRRMTRGEKQSYGNTLLSMAASSALPAGVVATTFATEKRDLKERLEQIMHYKKNEARLLAAVLALALLAGCAVGAGPAPSKPAEDKTPEAPAENAVRVTNVDELLAAIAPNAVIELAEGEFDLSAASNYGEDTHSTYVSWNGVWGEEGRTSAELVISGVDGLTLRGAGQDKTVISAEPRYANVLRFVGCKDLTLSGLTAGHTREPGFCSGGVLRLENCTRTALDDCGLYGCGVVGVWALDCVDLFVRSCRIYECSYNAVSVNQCRNVRVEDCEIDSHGIRPGQGEAMMLFDSSYTDGFTVHGCRIHDNAAQYLLHASYTKNALFLSNDVHDNRVGASMFLFDQYPAVVDGCRFETNDFRAWVPDHRFDPVDVSGEPLEAAELNEMTLRDIDPDIAVTPVSAEKAAEVRPGGEIAVKTVDEFLTAIGPDRTIVLDGALFDLSTASNYGSAGGEYYYWAESHDGPQLVIHDVGGLTLRAKSDDAKATTLAAVPRYANVLSFKNCENLELVGFTAGHTEEPGVCSGGVLEFQSCNSVRLDGMRLYGCGILGIQAGQCTSMDVRRTEIYECSQGAAQFFQCDGLVFTDCDVHDVPSPAFSFTQCGDKLWNGTPLSGLDSRYDVDADGNLIVFESTPREEREFNGAVQDLENPFAAEPTFSYPANSAEQRFALAVQRAIAVGDWEALADRISFPLQFFTDHYSFVIHDREEYMGMVRDGYFTNELFNDTFEFPQRVADADASVFGSCVFGITCLDHLVAFVDFGGKSAEDDLKIRAVSVLTPLWPGGTDGTGSVLAVPPTPQP